MLAGRKLHDHSTQDPQHGTNCPAGLPLFNIWAIRALMRQPTLEAVSTRPPEASALPTEASEATEPEPRSNYLLRHWRGQLPLPVSCWVNGSLLSLVLLALYPIMEAGMREMALRTAAWVNISVILFSMSMTIWSGVGIWRSADHHPQRGGSRGWAAAARVVVALSALSFAVTLVRNWAPQLKENAAIATGFDPLGTIDAKLTSDGAGLVLRGMFGTGSADEIRRLLGAAPGVRTLMLESAGGRLREAEEIAKLARERGLNTYVESHCESACTYILLAGRDRAATPNARIGFHKPTFPGLNRSYQARATAQMLQFYRRAGFSEPFIEHVGRTPADEMWYPSRAELIDNGVINRVSFGGEMASLATKDLRSKSDYARALRGEPVMAALERRFPGTIDQAVAAAWQAFERGGNDGDITSAAREALNTSSPDLIQVATDAQLESFARLSIDQLAAAQAVSDAACGLLIASELDVQNVLPPELIEREIQWTTQVLEGAFQPLPHVSNAQFDAALTRAFKSIAAEHVEVVSDLPAYADQPGLQCAASIALYKSVLGLPAATRKVALRGLFQSEAQ